MGDKARKVVKGFVLGLWGLVFLTAIYFYFKLGVGFREVPGIIAEFVGNFGIWGPLLYISLYALRPLLFFPATVFTAASGAIFGPYLGLVYTLIGENLSAGFAFFLGRFLGRHFVEEHEAERFRRLDYKFRENGFITVLIMRLVYLPFDLVNYGSGLSSVKYRDYALATFIGILPGATTFVFLGGGVHGLFNLFIAGFVFVVGLGISKFVKKSAKAREVVVEKIYKERGK